jgi:hypothetical protein
MTHYPGPGRIELRKRKDRKNIRPLEVTLASLGVRRAENPLPDPPVSCRRCEDHGWEWLTIKGVDWVRPCLAGCKPPTKQQGPALETYKPPTTKKEWT